MEIIKKYLPSPLVLLAFLIGFIVNYSVGLAVLQDPDMSWHIAAGDLIRETGNIAPNDPWSFSNSQQIWYNISWLWDIILSIVHEKFGIQGLFVFAATLPALVVSALVLNLRLRGGIGINATIFMGMLATYSMIEFAAGRPQIVSIFLALIFHQILHVSRLQQKSWKIFLLPFLMILWVNVHGSFFVGLALIGAYGLEAIFYKNKERFFRLLLVGILCVLATTVNPYGVYLYTAIMRAFDSVITKYIMEWTPFVFGYSVGASLLFLTIILFSNLRANNTLLADKIVTIIWLLAMLFSVRNTGFLAVLSAPYLAANLPQDDEKDKHTRKLLVWVNNMRFSPVIAALVLPMIIASYFLLPVLGKERYVEKLNKSPLPAINYVLQNYAGQNIMNDYDFGGRIIYEARGKIPIFVDGRAGTVYDEKILEDSIAFANLDKDWEKILESRKIDIILLGNGRSFAQSYDKGLYNDKWQQVFRDDVASVYVRKKQ